MTETPPVQTHVRKITVGTPVRKVTGAQAQTLNDLTDVDTTGNANFAILQFNATRGKFEVTTEPDGLEFDGGTF
jgi:hypothetical protein|tara:strand:- start:245 stop:466 length:222 start_codon:yes stop_codon:yes gene_type:complete